MSATVERDLRLRARAWLVALLAPLALAGPWLLLCRGLGAPAEVGTLRALLLVLLLLTATVTDLRWRRIYNWTTYTALGWVVVLEAAGAALAGGPATAALGMLPWRESLAGFAVGFGVLFVLYNVFHGGAGDLKLVAVLGALVGANRVIEVLIYSYIVAGVFAACLLVGAAGPGALLALAARAVGLGGRLAEPSERARDCLKRRLPMAPFIAGGTLLAVVFV